MTLMLQAGQAELDAGRALRAMLMGLATSGSAKSLTPLTSANLVANVLEAVHDPGMPTAGFVARPSWKNDLCAKLEGLGFDARFWWIN